MGGSELGYSRQYIFPGTSFTCEGNLTGWTYLLAENVGNQTQVPELQIWELDGTAYIRRSTVQLSSGLDVEADRRQFSQILNSPLEVGPGNVLGVYLPPIESCPYIMFMTDAPAGSGMSVLIAEGSQANTVVATALSSSSPVVLLVTATIREPCI